MSDFRFANPNWIHAVWGVAAMVVLLFWLDWRRGDALSRLVSVVMQTRLVHRLSRTRRWLSIALLGLAGLALTVALMRPQWGLTYQETPRVGAQIMVCLDVSKSMLAEDTAPNRLDRAKAELTDLLSYLQGDEVGLIGFAGRATVLCPLTPDFGFFRLVLDGAGPDSVGRGGTRLEEPIRKAIDGFRTESDVSRLIVLITDGEDHDSHPLDAAKEAAERGVKVLTIGFGDEAGSEIQYTDPQTGVRTVVTDSGGAPVVSRLDGETLRKIALETEGAYIPAGTGALDLKSIYDAHIAPLVRGQFDARGRAIRREGFQWAVLVGLVLLVASIAVGSGSARSEIQRRVAETAPSTASKVGAAALLIALAVSTPLRAQAPDDAEPPAAPETVSEGGPADIAKAKPQEDLEGRDPRDLYNEALAFLDNDVDRAERYLIEARRNSGTDGDVRFRATYNMGWVEVKRADAVLGEKPEEALAHLRRGADWFRDAVRLRPDHSDARYNLEIVLRRILELADSLKKTEQRDLAQRLDALIAQQRTLVGGARQVVERVADNPDPNAVDRFQGDFRQLAVAQRKLLSDSQALSASVHEELEALDDKSDQEKSPQDQVRAAQLGAVLQYASQAEQRMGQARSQMRQRQADRAFRRAAAALDELKRARDQLRNPVEVLDVVLADAAATAQLTSNKAAADRPSLMPDTQTDAAPAWLTAEYLEEEQLSLTQRVSELAGQLQAALDHQADRPAGPPTPQQQEERAQADRFLAMVRAAMPHLNRGKEAFEAAGQSLTGEQYDPALQHQLEAINALRDARERFLELRGLIELAYSREKQIQALLASLLPTEPEPAPETKPEPPSEPKADEKTEVDTEAEGDKQDAPQPDEEVEVSEEAKVDEKDTPQLDTAEKPEPEQTAPPKAIPVEQQVAALEVAKAVQTANSDRGVRIATLIDRELAALPPATENTPDASSSGQQDPAAQQAEAQRQQLELATELIKQAQAAMADASKSLGESIAAEDSGESSESPSPDVSEAVVSSARKINQEAFDASRVHVDQAVEHLQSLRRLFFSIVEHLRETAQRQAQLNDETEQAAPLKDEEEVVKKVGPLSTRQQELRTITGEIADALAQQAQQQPPGAAPGQNVDPKQLAQLQQIQQQFGKAAKLVAEGGVEMESAEENLAFKKPIVDRARKHQDQALAKLAEALALLQPPQPDQQNQQNNQQQQDQQQEQQQDEGKQDEKEKSEMGTDPARLLQAIRDREAQRRREQERRGQFQREPVEKDW